MRASTRRGAFARISGTALLGITVALSGCGSDDDPAPAGGGTTTVPNELQSEARPLSDTDTFFGGNDATDSSGSVTYLLIGESGVGFAPDAEVQGLTLEGVGSGTTINHIQIFGSEDDGIEWFGGTVDVTHFVVQDVDDDGIDFDDGYSGTVQYGIIRMGDTDGDAGIEADNAGPSDDAVPVTRPELANLLIIGKAAKSPGGEGANLKVGFGGDLEHVVFVDDQFVTGGSGGFDEAIFDVDNQVDSSLDARGVVYRTTSAGGLNNADSDTLEADWAAGNPTDGGAAGSLVYNVQEDAAMTVDADFKVSTTATLDTTVSTADAYYGAVDPAAATPWFEGWTVPIGDSTALTAGGYTHPLEDDIGTAITPAAAANCPTDGDGNQLPDNGTVTVFGQVFPVCVIEVDVLADLTLTNDHVYVVDDNIKVGDGGVRDQSSPLNVTLTIEAGTQIYGDEGTASLIRVTRGSLIFVNGTADQPVIMASVAYSPLSGITGDPTDLSGRGQWGGLVINGFAPTNSLDE